MQKNLQTRFSTRQYMLSRDFELYYYNEHYTSKVDTHTHDYYEFYFFMEGDVSVVHNHAQAYRRFVFWVSREYASRLMELSPAYGYLMQRAEVSGKNVFHSDVITFNATQFKIFQLIEEMQMERFGREARIPLLVNDLILHLNRMVYEEENPAMVKEQDL